MRTALHHRSFRQVACLYTGDALVEWLGTIALMVLVHGTTGSATVAASMLICKQVLPGVLVTLAGGAIDRLGPHAKVVALAFVAQAAALAGVGVLGFGPGLFLFAAISGTAGAVVRSSLRTIVATELRGEALRGGNAVLNISASAAGLIGPALGALAVASIGPGSSLLIAGALIAGASVVARSLPAPSPSAHPGADGHASQSSPNTRSGSVIPVSWLLTLVAALSCVFAMDDPALLLYSENALGAGVAGYGAIFCAWGIGSAIGSVLFSRLLHWPMLRIYAVATVLAGLAYVGLSVAPSIALACTFAVLGGIGNGMDWVALVTAIQEATPRGREAVVGRRLEAVTSIGPGLGIVLGGVVADLASPRATLLIPGVAAFVILAAGTLALRARASRVAACAARHTTFIPSIHGGSA